MKKLMIALITAFALMALTACGGSSDSVSETEEQTETTTQTTEATTEEPQDSSFEEFKKTMDDYEAFMNDYCDLMEKYNSDPASVMDEYLEMNQKYLTVMDELDAIDEDELTDEELAYYLEVMNRINTRLAEVAY